MDRPIDKHRPGRNHILKLWNERQAVVGGNYYSTGEFVCVER